MNAGYGLSVRWSLEAGEVEIGLQLETRGKHHCEEVMGTLRGKGYQLKFG